MKKLALCLFLSAVLLAGVIAPAVAAEPVALAATPSATLFDRKDGSENHVDIDVTIPASVDGNKFLRLEIDGVPFAVDRNLVREMEADGVTPKSIGTIRLDKFAEYLVNAQLAPDEFVRRGCDIDEMKAFLALGEDDAFPPRFDLLDFANILGEARMQYYADLTEYDYIRDVMLGGDKSDTAFRAIKDQVNADAGVPADQKEAVIKEKAIAAVRAAVAVDIDKKILEAAINGNIIAGTPQAREDMISAVITDAFNKWFGSELQEEAAMAAVVQYLLGRIGLKNDLLNEAKTDFDTAKLIAMGQTLRATFAAMLGYPEAATHSYFFEGAGDDNPIVMNVVIFSDVLAGNIILPAGGLDPLKGDIGKAGVKYVRTNLVPEDSNTFSILASDLVTLYAGKHNVSFIFGKAEVKADPAETPPVEAAAEVIEHVAKFELTVVDTTVYSVLDNSEEGGTLAFSGNTVKAFSDADGRGVKVTGGNDVTIKITPDKGNSISYVYLNGVSVDQILAAKADALEAGGAEPYPYWKISEDYSEIVILNVASDNSIMVQFYGVPDNGIDGNVMLWILLGVLTAGALTLAFVAPVRKRAGK